MSITMKCREDANGRTRDHCACVGNRHRWLVRIYVGRSGVTESGNRGRKNRSKLVVGTRREAEKVETAMRAQRDKGALPPRSTRETVEMYLLRWLDGRQNIRARTQADYRSKVTLYLLPALGMVPLKDLTAGHVRDLIATFTSRERPLSPRTIRYVVGILKHALDVAAAQGLIPFNPLANRRSIELPQYRRASVRYLTPEQVTTFLAAVATDRLSAFWRLMLLTGLRPSEALALRWQDVRLGDGTVTVRRSLQPGGTFAEPKTAAGRRTLTLDATTLADLKAHRQRIAQTQQLPTATALVFSTKSGEPLDITNLGKRCKKLCSAAGVPEVSLYGLRHSNATLLLATGIPAKVASERLGHSTVKLTLDTYTHVTSAMEQEAAERIANYERAIRARATQ